jgi:hypothetical protein
VSWMFLAIEKYGGDEDLRDLNRRNVIPYVHGRIDMSYCCELNLLESLKSSNILSPVRSDGDSWQRRLARK